MTSSVIQPSSDDMLRGSKNSDQEEVPEESSGDLSAPAPKSRTKSRTADDSDIIVIVDAEDDKEENMLAEKGIPAGKEDFRF